MKKFEASTTTQGITEHDTAEAAIAVVETAGDGSVTLFNVTKNRPGCLPEHVHNAYAMWVFEAGKWFSISIFGGLGDRIGEEKPH